MGDLSGESSGDQVWLVTGASRGLGMALTQQLLAGGARVAATARRTGPLAGLQHLNREQLLVTAADMTSRQLVEAMVGAALGRFRRIDVLVNNAGSGLFGAIEELSDEEILGQLDTNVLGPWRFLRAVLPGMRTRRHGTVVNVSSVAGFVAQPGNGAYNASKAAFDGMTEALAREVSRFGVRVLLVQPGPFRTAFLGHSAGPAARIDAYPDYAEATRGRAGRQASDPAKIAAQIIKAVQHPDPAFRLVLGSDAWSAMQARLDVISADLSASYAAAMSTAIEDHNRHTLAPPD
jgi:NAD(P)-dependent dehydrogenase (short-subunit alcohol dehydrogenase family)